MANEKITQILDEIKALTILEVADLVKALEEEFGVSAAPVAVAGAAAPAAAGRGSLSSHPYPYLLGDRGIRIPPIYEFFYALVNIFRKSSLARSSKSSGLSSPVFSST